jgi:hypothetical protein
MACMGRNDPSGKRQQVSVLVSHLERALDKNEALTFFSRCISISLNVNVTQGQKACERLNAAEVQMKDQSFQDAYARVRGRHTDQAWFALSPREITDAIYREIRAIDRERLMSSEADEASVAVAAE